MGSKRVVFLCSQRWTGGPSVFLRRVCKELPRLGWTCKLVLTGSSLSPLFNYTDWPGELEVLKPSYSWPALVKSVVTAIDSFNADIVVGTAIHGASYAVRYLHGKKNCLMPFLDTVQSDIEAEYNRINNNKDIISAVGAVSDACFERIKQHIPELTNRVRRIYYPIPCPSTFPDRVYSGTLKLAYSGMVRHDEKCVLDLIPLAISLHKKGVPFKLTIIGDGVDRFRLQDGLSAIPEIERQVEFLGWLTNEEALKVLAQQHVLLLMSSVEGQSIAMLEAMGQGVVPVVSDLPGLREVIRDGESGFLLEVGNIDQFISKITALSINPQMLQKMGHAAWCTIRSKYAMGIAVKRFAELLDWSCNVAIPNASTGKFNPYNTMSNWNVPHFIQGIKRRALRQELH